MENRRLVAGARRDGEAALFAAYWKWKDADSGEIDEEARAESATFEAIATGWAPESESALLLELVEQGTGLAEPLTCPNHLAVVNAYRHRLQALRCEYAEARLRTVEAEEELRAARLRIADLDAQLQKIYASRWWKVRKRVAWCWHLVLRWLGRLDRTQSNAVVPRV